MEELRPDTNRADLDAWLENSAKVLAEEEIVLKGLICAVDSDLMSGEEANENFQAYRRTLREKS